MAKNVKIIVKRGATIMESTEGRRFPESRVVGFEIPAMGELLTDEETGDRCWEFKFGRKTWTVDYDQVEIVK
jgi:hypothetical protein